MKHQKTTCRLIISFLLLLSINAFSSNSHLITKKIQANKTPQEVLKSLEAGNTRYIHGATRNYNQRELAKLASKKGQAPLAFILSCIDSRAIPEVVFNQPAGALFVARNAGNLVSTYMAGSAEFATQYVGTKLVVIMGHTQCGAIVGACKQVNKPKNLASLLAKIKPAVSKIAAAEQVKKSKNNVLNCNDKEVIDEIAKQNVLNQIAALKNDSPATEALVKSKKIMIVGAIYNLTTGKVSFFDSTGKSLN